MKRLTIIVLDSVGVGELLTPTSAVMKEANTLANTAKAVGGLKLPNLQKLGGQYR